MINVDSLTGKFHSHITVSATDKVLAHEILNKENIRHKLTVIELSDFNKRQQLDAMITQHFHTRKWKSYQSIRAHLDKTCKVLEQNGITVLRLKIEHEDVFYNPTDCNYIECHIKVNIPLEQRNKIIDSIKNNPNLAGFVPSRNPNEVKGEECHQFFNKRWYNGTLEKLLSEVNAAKKILNNYGKVKEAKVESAIFDSNNNLDRWWA